MIKTNSPFRIQEWAVGFLPSQTFRFGLNYNDLDTRNPRHSFTALDGSTTLIDCGYAEVHLVPHYDLAEILRWHEPNSANFRAFRTGYQMTETDFAVLLAPGA